MNNATHTALESNLQSAQPDITKTLERVYEGWDDIEQEEAEQELLVANMASRAARHHRRYFAAIKPTSATR